MDTRRIWSCPYSDYPWPNPWKYLDHTLADRTRIAELKDFEVEWNLFPVWMNKNITSAWKQVVRLPDPLGRTRDVPMETCRVILEIIPIWTLISVEVEQVRAPAARGRLRRRFSARQNWKESFDMFAFNFNIKWFLLSQFSTVGLLHFLLAMHVEYSLLVPVDG